MQVSQNDGSHKASLSGITGLHKIITFDFLEKFNFPAKAVAPIYTERKIKYINRVFFRKCVFFRAYFLILKGCDSCFLAPLDVTVLLGKTQARVWQLENPSHVKENQF